MSLVVSIFSQDILPIFVVAGVGFLLARRFGAHVKTLSTVAFNALSPCLVFDQLVSGRQNPATAYMTGKVKIDGDLGAVMKLQRLFG